MSQTENEKEKITCKTKACIKMHESLFNKNNVPGCESDWTGSGHSPIRCFWAQQWIFRIH